MARPEKLTDQMRAFCDAYLANGGNGSAAAKTARYAGDRPALAKVARVLLRKKLVQQYLVDVTKEPDPVTGQPTIADAKARQAWWTKVMMGEPQAKMIDGELELVVAPWPVRMRASEMLGKSQGDFIDRVEVAAVDPVIELPSNGRGDLRPSVPQPDSESDATDDDQP